jgi:hypothetical protein
LLKTASALRHLFDFSFLSAILWLVSGGALIFFVPFLYRRFGKAALLAD